MILTFFLLSLAIISVWLNREFSKEYPLPIWALLLIAAMLSGLFNGYLNLTGCIAIISLSAIAYLAQRTSSIFFYCLTLFMAVMLALHRIPGFHNPILVHLIRFSADAVPFTQYANFDKAAAGLILLGIFCKRSESTKERKSLFLKAVPILLATLMVLPIAVFLHLVRVDIKLPAYTPIFLVINLLFTCIAEEAFFRGFLQERLATLIKRTSWFHSAAFLSISISALSFGLAHSAGGYLYMMLATLTGLGYAYSYSKIQRIEAPILIHFLFNTFHFIFFTYPKLQASSALL